MPFFVKRFRFSAPGRIVALVSAMRDSFSSLLDKKIAEPLLDIYDPSISPSLVAAIRLIASDGLG
jgi:hypothetical protein